MNSISAEFVAIHGGFWRWSSEGDCIYWADGPTLCLKDELITILESINESAITTPDITLIMIGLRRMKSELSQGMISSLQTYLNYGNQGSECNPSHVKSLLESMGPFLEITPRRRLEIILSIPGIQSVSRTDQLAYLRTQPDHSLSTKFSLCDIHDTSVGTKDDLNKIHDLTNDLASHISTGIRNTNILKNNSPVNILCVLEKTSRFRAVARLARRLIPVISTPVDINESALIETGGFSDITNRGKPENLMPIELAQDNEMLASRIVHREALFYRRESTPPHKPRRRHILVDTGILSWGRRRIINASITLALASNARRQDDVRIFTTSGNAGLVEADFQDISGWEDFISRINPNPDPGDAWIEWIRSETLHPTDEIYLISHEITAGQPGFTSRLTEIIESSQAIVCHLSINDDNDLTLRKLTGGYFETRLIKKLDSDEINRMTGTIQENEHATNTNHPTIDAIKIPAYFRKQIYHPFYYPVDPAGIRNFTMNKDRDQLAGISHFGELYYWRHKGQLARILDENCPEPVSGKIHLHGKFISLVLKNPQSSEYFIRHYTISGSRSGYPGDIVIKHHISSPPDIEFHQTALVLKTENFCIAVNYFNGEVIHEQPMHKIRGAGWIYSASPHWGLHKKPSQSHFDQSTSATSIEEANAMIGNPDHIGPVSVFGDTDTLKPVIQAQSGKCWQLEILSEGSEQKLMWCPTHTPSPHDQRVKSKPLDIPRVHKHNIKSLILWESGLISCIDRYGAIHFAGESIPEKHLSIMTIINGSTVAWRPDNQYFGNMNLLWGEPANPAGDLTGSLEIIGRMLTQ